MIKKLSLSFNSHVKLFKYCKKKGIEYVSTPFDISSIKFLKKLEVRCFKIPSGTITNLPYLRFIGKYGKPIILSTGMSTLEEVKKALQVLIKSGTPRNKITILHCNTEYPTPLKDVNLKAMITIKNKFKVKVGYSDHTLGIEVAAAAVALGATLIEKHFTLSRGQKGPDHCASLEPKELKKMVDVIRNVELAMGHAKKKPSPSEKKNISVARNSIVAACEIRKGELFSDKNLAVKRPGHGLSPMKWDKVIGRKSNKDYQSDDLIKI